MVTYNKNQAKIKIPIKVIIGIRRQRKYHKNLLAINKKRLEEALADKFNVIKVLHIGSYNKIFYLKGNPKWIYSTFGAASKIMKGRLYYYPCKGSMVNLCHFLGFKKEGEEVLILLANKTNAKLDKIHLKSLEAEKLYLDSYQYLDDINKCQM